MAAIMKEVYCPLPSPCKAFSQSLSVNSFRWRIRGERAGNALKFSRGPRDQKRFGREEKWGLGTRQYWPNDEQCYNEIILQLPWLQGITLECFSFKGTVQC